MYPGQVWPSKRAERLKALVPTLDVEGILEISAIQSFFVEIPELWVPFGGPLIHGNYHMVLPQIPITQIMGTGPSRG